jgi:hypothetical protein
MLTVQKSRFLCANASCLPRGTGSTQRFQSFVLINGEAGRKSGLSVLYGQGKGRRFATDEIQPRISRISRIRSDDFPIREIREIRGEKSTRIRMILTD